MIAGTLLAIVAITFLAACWRYPAPRWSDHDRRFGPFTYAGSDYVRWGIVASSMDDDGHGAHIRFHFGPRTLMLATPGWLLRPAKTPFTSPRYPGKVFHHIRRREIGFSVSEGYLSLKFGRQTHDSTTDQSKGWFIPWTQWRFIGHRLYDTRGNLFAILNTRAGYSDTRNSHLRESVPCARFAFLDGHDHAPILATTFIEEREWAKGEGWFRWLAWFTPNMVRRSLDLRFSDEVGARKGSWKGGTIGTGCDMKPGETIEGAFERWCVEQGHVFVREPHLFERYGLTEKPAAWNNEVLGWFHRGPELRLVDDGGEFSAGFDAAGGTASEITIAHGSDAVVGRGGAIEQPDERETRQATERGLLAEVNARAGVPPSALA